jgi:F0F1-type ATP synthase assembly protein I
LDLRGLHEVNTGLGDGLAAAVELIATPFVFGVLGHLLDRWLGTQLVFMFTFALVVLAYEVWKLVSRYLRAMNAHEASAKWARPNRSLSEGVSDG